MQALIVRTRFLILNFCLEHGINMNLIKTRRIMKKIFFPIVIMATLLVAGCAKENLIEPEAPQQDAPDQTGVTELSAAVELPSKTVLQNDAKVLWTNGDAINVNGAQSAALELDEPVGEMTFTFESVITPPYKAVFPASIYKDATTVTLPAYQTYKEGTFSASASPMAAFSENSSLKFNHLCSVLKLTVNLPADSEHKVIKYVDFYGKNGEQVSGDFTLDFENMTLAGSSTAEADKTLRYYVSKTLGEDPFVMYIVVPAQEYANGYTIKLLDEKGHFMEQSKASAETLVAGKIYEKPAFDFVPTGTDLDVEIASAQDLIDFATAYNAREYADEDLLVVSLSQDIVFDETTSAAYAATGGIGTAEEDAEGNTNYFNGVFDGNGKAIKGYVANIPLFAYTGSNGDILSLDLDETCVLTLNPGTASNYHGLLVGRHKGEINNCTSAAKVVINNLEDCANATQYYGGLVGRNYGGDIVNSVVTGDITCSQTGVSITKNNVSLGGIAGGQADNGTIGGCAFKGNITVSDGSDFGGISAAKRYFYVGGIVGYVENGNVLNSTAGAEGVSTKIDVRGTLVPSVGGVVAWVVTSKSTEISGCKNYMAMSYASNGARGDTTPCRIGGIASRSMAPVSKSENYGAISSLGNSTSVYLGGIVGDGAGALNCTNHTTGTVTRTSQLTTAQGNRYMYIGGISGGINSAADFENCTNNAAVLNGNTGTSTNTTVDVGGIVGAAYDGGTSYQLDFNNCVNTGQITAQATQSTAIVTTRATVGGIIGYGAAPSTTITGCDNSGYVYCQYNGKNSEGRCAYTGGIAGLLGGNATGAAGLEISNCDNTGVVYNRNYNSIAANTLAKGSYGGGIVGAINGTAESKAIVKDCTSSTGNLNCYRGINGGIAGYAGNATLTNNVASQVVNPNGNVEGIAGILGQAVATSVDQCTFSGLLSVAKNVGGLVYLMDGTSSITNCKVDGATIKKGSVSAAVLVSNAAAGATITGCGVKGTLDGAAITLESTMVAIDGGATVTGTYLLD